MVELSKQVQIYGVGTTGTSGELRGGIIDMASNGGWESIMAVGFQSASQEDALVKFQTGTASGSLADTTGEAAGKTTLYLDCFRPRHRFVEAVFEAGSATIAFRSLHTFVYGGRKQPATQPASTTGDYVQTPGVGSATA